MLFAVDIDGTIATGWNAPSLQACIDYYRALGIHLPSTISDYTDLLQIPAVMRIHEVLPSAVEGVRQLARLGNVAYYTVRKSPDALIHAQIQEATRFWLATHQFPHPEQVVFCLSSMNKLIRIYHHDSLAALVLIDDRPGQVLAAFDLLVAGGHPKFDIEEQKKMVQVLRQRLVVVAFGVEKQPFPNRDRGLQVLTLPSWEQVSELVLSLDLHVESSL
jgi:hypothetical protein